MANEPPEHELFDKWTGSDVKYKNKKAANAERMIFVMPAEDVTLTANYKPAPKYKVTVVNGTADKSEAYAGQAISTTTVATPHAPWSRSPTT